MAYAELHVLERKSPVVRGGRRVAPALRAEMEARGATAKELADEIKLWARHDPIHRQAVDYRTIQKAMDGQCALETFFTLAGFFGWDFGEQVLTPVIGADPLTAREVELEQRLASAAALHARVERDRALRAAAAPALALVARAPAVPGARTGGESRSFTTPAPAGV